MHKIHFLCLGELTMLPRPPSGKVRGRSLLKDLSRGGSSRSERNETLMIEYIYLFIGMHNVKSCLSVRYPVYKISQLKTHSCSIRYQRLYRCGLGYSSVAL